MEDFPLELVLAALLAVSELLAVSPLKSNSLFQLVRSILQSLKVAKEEVEKLEDKKDE